MKNAVNKKREHVGGFYIARFMIFCFVPKMRCMRKNPLFFLLFFSIAAFTALGADIIHTIQSGETVFALSRRYGVSADAILEANNISNPDRIRAGAELKIPQPGSSASYSANASRGPSQYVVESGDSLYGLARRFGVSVSDLAAANGLDRNALLKIGDTLSIPAQSSGSGSAHSHAMEDPRNYEKKKIDAGVVWPVEPQDIAYLTGKIYGVSITSSRGASVKNIATGTVLSIGPYRGFGQVVFVQSNDGYIYVYGGLENIGVKSNEHLSFGDRLGTLGLDPLSGKSQLYFMVYKKDFPVDPATAPRG